MNNPPAPRPAATVPRRARWFTMLALVVGIGIGAATTAVVVTAGDDPAPVSSTADLSDVQASCQDWMGSAQGDATDDQWCTDMFAWMGEQSGGSMMDSMMWRDREHMSTACREWAGQHREDSGTKDQQRCNEMATWMDAHMSNHRGSWMMQDQTR